MSLEGAFPHVPLCCTIVQVVCCELERRGWNYPGMVKSGVLLCSP